VRENGTVTKKEIVKQISDEIGLTQLKTKEIVQLTFDAIIDTLLNDESHRIELRNFGVFEVKLRKPRKARNPRTGARVDVPAKAVVTFKPGKEMEEKVREIPAEELMTDEEAAEEEPVGVDANGVGSASEPVPAPRSSRHRKGS
jgi:nucleoid DNA-binding protein